MRRSLCLFGVLALAACGGGGGPDTGARSSGATGTAPAHAAPSSQSASSPTVLALQGGGTLTLNSDNTAIFQPAGSGNIDVAPLNGPAPPNPQSYGGTVLYQQTPGQLPTASIELMGKATGLSASEFGAWKSYDGAGNVTATNFFAAGQMTPSSQIPMPGSGITATYNGRYVGTETVTGQAAMPINGGAQIVANFGSGAIRANFSGGPFDMISGHVPSTMTPGANTYTVQGNTFSLFQFGQYTINGAFHGTPAPGGAPPETAGTFNGSLGRPGVVATGPTAPINATFNGSFGAHM